MSNTVLYRYIVVILEEFLCVETTNAFNEFIGRYQRTKVQTNGTTSLFHGQDKIFVRSD